MTGDAYALIANARAGNRDPRPAEAAMAVLAGHGDVARFDTTDAGDLDAVLDEAGERTLVVVGGDGSLHTVVERLHRRQEDRVIGLIPAGTGNDLARGVGLPLDPSAAARIVVEGRPAGIDLLVDDAGGVVVNAVHAGLGGEAADRAGGWKPALGPMAYPLGALIAGVREGCWSLDVVVDGSRVEGDGPVLMVGICNGPLIGSGTPLSPPADPGDGRLDVVVARACSVGERAAFAGALRAGRHLSRADVTRVTGGTVSVGGDPVRYTADGEVSEPVPARSYRVRAGGWRLVLPPGSRSGSRGVRRRGRS